MLKSEQQNSRSQTSDQKSQDLNKKIDLLNENVQSLLERNQTIDDDIKTVKSIAASVANQVYQINVSSVFKGIFMIFFLGKP